MTSPKSITALPLEKNRDYTRINRHACEVRGTLHINMCKDAQLKLNTILTDALTSSPNEKKRKIQEAIDVTKDLDTSITNSKRNFQAGGFVMRQRANDNASYEEANLKRCILNGKNPNTYTCIHNYDAEMISVYTRLNFGCTPSFASPPLVLVQLLSHHQNKNQMIYLKLIKMTQLQHMQ